MTTTTNLPAVIDTYLTAHRSRDVDKAIAMFLDDATVTDEGKTHRGVAEIRHWIANAATEFTYTVELTGTQRIDDDHWVATHHLEGDFPGGVVDLNYDFTLHESKIQHLTIAP